MLNFGRFNLRGFIHNQSFLNSLVADLDILAVSEHWLDPPELHYFSHLGNDFFFLLNHSLLLRTPYLTIIWKR